MITHNDAPKAVGLLWTSDQLVAKTSTWQHTTLATVKHPCIRRDSNSKSQLASGRRPARLLGSASLICRQRKKFIYYSIGRVVTGFKNSAVSPRPEFCSLSVDRRLTWRKHITTKRKQLDLKLRYLYWIVGRKSQLSLENKLLIYKLILKPVWIYGIQLWGTASNSNLEILERFQSKVLRIITDAPWYMPNTIIKRDLQIPTVKQEPRKYSANYRKRLDAHPNNLANALFHE
jgi:hypothetical protein